MESRIRLCDAAAGHKVVYVEHEIGGYTGYTRFMGDSIERSAQFGVLGHKSANVVETPACIGECLLQFRFCL